MMLTIDPGLTGTGFALWSHKSLHIFRTGIIRPPRQDTLPARAFFIAEHLRLACGFAPGEVYCEYPAYFQTTKGAMVASRGDLVKLAYLVGFITAHFASDRTLIELVPVNKWIGQLPKTVMQQRVLKKLGGKVCKDFKSHVWDAVGIGLYIKGAWR